MIIVMLLKYLSQVKDHRRSEGKRYDLPHFLLFVILASLSGADSYRKVSEFIGYKFDFLKSVFDLKWKKVPAYCTVRDFIQGLDKGSFEESFREYSESLNDIAMKDKDDNDDEEVYLKKYQFLSVDGKILRKSFDNFNDVKARQLLSVFNTDNKLILAHKEIEEKTNEIPAFQELIHELKLDNVIFTLDAMHCQKKQ